MRTRSSRALLIGILSLTPACASIWGFNDLTVGESSDASGDATGDATTGGADGPLEMGTQDAAAPGDASGAVEASAEAGADGATPADAMDSAPLADAPAEAQDAAPADAADGPTARDASDAGPAPEGGATDAPIDSGPTFSLAVTVVAFGPTVGALASTPPGIGCSGGCVQTLVVPQGTTVHLAVTGVSHTLMRWGGACSGTSSTCDVSVNANTSVKLVMNAYNYAFVTSSAQAGDFGGLNPVDGGLPPADAICAQAAAAANLPGSYKAFFSTASLSAKARFSGARGWIRVDGLPVFDALSQLAQGTMYYPLDVDENGQKAPADACVWTASNQDGTYYSGSASCNGWTSALSTDYAVVGVDTWESGGWANTNTATVCSSQCAVYCMGTDLNATVSAPTNAGRVAFLSTGTWSPSSGVAAANSLCNLEATAASLGGTYAALLATSTQSAIAAAGFDLTGANWVRPDGVPVAANPSALSVGNLIAAIDVHADGTYQSTQTSVWTGATSPSTAGTDATTCSNWTVTDASAAYSSTIQGKPNDLAAEFFYFYGFPTDCATARQLYCLQK